MYTYVRTFVRVCTFEFASAFASRTAATGTNARCQAKSETPAHHGTHRSPQVPPLAMDYES